MESTELDLSISLGGWERCPDHHHCKVWQRSVEDGHLTVLVASPKGPEKAWHLSISHRKNVSGVDGNPIPGRIPTWDEIKDARYRFVPDDVNMAMMLPPKRMYLNYHPTTMHLWQIPIKYAGNPE